MQPTLLAKGFRPFFLSAAAFAALIIPVWLLVLRGDVALPAGTVGAYWHAHEMLHGFVVAIIVGFLLTAASNWTGRVTAVGWSLGVLVLAWMAGRVVFLPWVAVEPWLRAVVDLALLPLAVIAIGRPIVAARSKRNYGFPVLLSAFWFTNLAWHLGAVGRVGADVPGVAMRVTLDLVLVVIAIVGGRIIPLFTRNATGAERIRGHRWADLSAIAGLVLLATLDAFSIVGPVPQVVAGAVALLCVIRARHWGARSSLAEPLLWVLHVGHAWIPIGLALRAAGPALPGVATSAWIHALAIGAVGTLIIGMMARVALGHTGRQLAAGRWVTAAFVAVTLAALTRVVFALVGGGAYVASLDATAGLWTIAFGVYAVVFAPVLVSPRPDGRPG